MQAITGYGLGGSSIALFGRVGGGIYTKVGAAALCMLSLVLCCVWSCCDQPRGCMGAAMCTNVGGAAAARWVELWWGLCCAQLL